MNSRRGRSVVISIGLLCVAGLAFSQESEDGILALTRETFVCGGQGGRTLPRGTAVFVFPEDRAASAAVKVVFEAAGRSRELALRRSGKFKDIKALTCQGTAYLIYNAAFMKRAAASGDEVDWAARFVLAHELAHHLEIHTASGKPTTQIQEVQADKLAGFVLARQGASLAEALSFVKAKAAKDESASYPSRDDRALAVEAGWKKGRKAGKPKAATPRPVTPPPITPKPLTPPPITPPPVTPPPKPVAPKPVAPKPVAPKPGPELPTPPPASSPDAPPRKAEAPPKPEPGPSSRPSSRPNPMAILRDRVLWNEASEKAQDAAIAKVSERLGGAYYFVKTQVYACQGQSHRIATFRHSRSGALLNLIPGGTYKMGSDSADYTDERPAHKAVIRRPFLIGKYEVSQEVWDGIGGEDDRNFKGEDLPIERASWNDVQAWLKKVGDGLRLPSEAEWEYACRAGTKTAFTFGANISTDQVNYDGNRPYLKAPKGVFREKTLPVASFAPNAFGLYQVHGNVWEWCQDSYLNSYRNGPEDERPRESAEAIKRILRGGSWINLAKIVRCAFRNNANPAYRGNDIGFRLARSIGD